MLIIAVVVSGSADQFARVPINFKMLNDFGAVCYIEISFLMLSYVLSKNFVNGIFADFNDPIAPLGDGFFLKTDI